MRYLIFIYLFVLGGLAYVRYSMLNNVMPSLSLWGYHSSSYIFACSAISSSSFFLVVCFFFCFFFCLFVFFCFVFFLFFFFLLVISGVPSLILTQTQVSAPLNSRPVDGYRKGGATPICIWNPA